MTKAVAKKETTDLSTEVKAVDTLGISADDIIIPKVLLMQSISQLVDADKAKAGDFVHSLDEVVIGSKENDPVEFIVFGMYKTITTYENDKYAATQSWSKELADKPWEEMIDGVKVNRNTAMNYYVIRTADVENMAVFPMVISFKRTSFKAGKKLATKLAMLGEFGAETYEKTFKLVAKQEEGDKGKYYVMDVSDGRKTSDVEKDAVTRWKKRLNTSSATVHEENSEEIRY